MKKLLGVWMMMAIGALAGCGKPEFAPVSGMATFKGEPVREGMLIFKNQDTGESFTGQLDAQGKYTMVTPERNGIPVGKYKVTVLPPFAAAAGPKKYENIPLRYRDLKTSDLELELVAKGAEFNIDLKP